jgi:hypothetical protein
MPNFVHINIVSKYGNSIENLGDEPYDALIVGNICRKHLPLSRSLSVAVVACFNLSCGFELNSNTMPSCVDIPQRRVVYAPFRSFQSTQLRYPTHTWPEKPIPHHGSFTVSYINLKSMQTQYILCVQ